MVGTKYTKDILDWKYEIMLECLRFKPGVKVVISSKDAKELRKLLYKKDCYLNKSLYLLTKEEANTIKNLLSGKLQDSRLEEQYISEFC